MDDEVEVNQALQKIAKGTGMVFVGSVISMFFGFLSRAVIARYFTTSEYGVFNLALTVLNIGLVFATLGFPSALPREVAFYKEKQPSQLCELISTALLITTLNSTFWVIILILEAENIAQIFNEEKLILALRVMILALPFASLTGLIVSISRGFGRVRENIYFKSVFFSSLFFIFILFGTLLKLSVTFIFSAYVLAQAFTFLALAFDVWKIKLFEFRISLNLKIGKEIVAFSLPLMLTGVLGYIMNWTDTLMLGYYKSSEVVGIYNAATPLARLLPMFLSSVAFIYMPIASSLYAQGKVKELKRVYQILTKWVFLLTLPFFTIIFIFPETSINFTFGNKYAGASQVLQILALGFMFHTFLGLNGLSLIVIGAPRLNLIGDLFAAIFNVFFNVLLIPNYGIIGASIATAISYFVANVFRSFWLYKKTGIHPFSWNYVKLLLISFVVLGCLKALNLRVNNVWYIVLILVLFLGVYFLLVLLSKSIDKEDIELLVIVKEKLKKTLLRESDNH